MKSLVPRLETSPFGLVSLAYQGGLSRQGIPSHGDLITAHRHQQLGALDLILSAVKVNRLSSDFLTNQEYLQAVENGFLFYYLSHPKVKSAFSIKKILCRLGCLGTQAISLLLLSN
ncbi:MAG: hypothetical protein JOZ78_01145 [Chroococcidiopsidaceae cyanobacterium CP_BM_ER_R8_30]|nr:hypothetical protein [Chroococcidiopsidaceae cyanobacterium CP_BM_ER_R8_30]